MHRSFIQQWTLQELKLVQSSFDKCETCSGTHNFVTSHNNVRGELDHTSYMGSLKSFFTTVTYTWDHMTSFMFHPPRAKISYPNLIEVWSLLEKLKKKVIEKKK